MFMSELKIKLLPSVEKCFLDEDIDKKSAITRLSMLKNERLSFQMAYTGLGMGRTVCKRGKLTISGELAHKITAYRIENVPVTVPAYPWTEDDNYLRREPGLYPDLMRPLDFDVPLAVVNGQLNSCLFTVEDADGIKSGEYEVTLTLALDDISVSETMKITVIDAMLPEQGLIHTQWFHVDCIAAYYGCEVYSERHFELIEKYMMAAVRCGVNMILTPIVTPPLDTGVGYERPTTQLVDITVNDGVYSYSYKNFDRYVELAERCGMKYFEMSHLFAQWGGHGTAKVMATVDGEYKRIFGWGTDIWGEEFGGFVHSFLGSLTEHLRELGIAERCYFHISDEPNLDHLELYTKAKELVAADLEGFHLMDALSDYDFYETGAVEIPIPSTNHIEPFIEHSVPDLWTYYCCGQHEDVSNRFLSMPGQRTRILGLQLFKYGIKGFLQWGFNFWNSQYSHFEINPYIELCGDSWVPAGDTFSVYPGNDGEPIYSLHALHFYEALQDLRALRLLENKLGHQAVVELIEEACHSPITFKNYPRGAEYLLGLRERVNLLL